MNTGKNEQTVIILTLKKHDNHPYNFDMFLIPELLD